MLEETNIFTDAIIIFTVCAVHVNRHMALGFDLCISKAVNLTFQDKVFIYIFWFYSDITLDLNKLQVFEPNSR